jgi:Inner membrane protein YgaP-like, transmembrane domain
MILNEGAADRVVRLVVAVAAVLLSWWAGFGSVGGILLLVFGGWMFVTGAVGVCPGYWLVKISTRPSPHRIAARGFRVAPHH